MKMKTNLPNFSAIKIMSSIVIGFLLIILNVELSISQKLLQKRSLMLVKNRVKRADANCTAGIITEEQTNEPTLPAIYSPEQLEACLSNDVLLKNLTELGNKAFNRDQLLVLMTKLRESFPGGLQQELIRNLGFIITVYGPEEISSWNITDPSILTLVLGNSLTSDVKFAVVSNYVQKSGQLNADVLNAIDGQILCNLTEENLQTILPNEFRRANPFNISTCTQAKKDIIFGIAEVAFQFQANDSNTYYNSLIPYISGAKASDLQSLATRNINMEYATFQTLNPLEVEKLTPMNIRDLLGNNLGDLKENETDAIVQRWINAHTKQEVESLGINLLGGGGPAGIGNILFFNLPSSASLNGVLSIWIIMICITFQSIL
ncbi:mesothelin-like protein isoform X2 [Narcine bancroftii]|uniref:mesothelin-like protein isoform X2 n=1 Tax=Narcine bancroftii TaxID=1343680 RepID=UPI003831B159